MRPTGRKGQDNGGKSSSFRPPKNQESFLTQDGWTRLIGDIFEESSDQLYGVSKRIDKLREFAGSCFEEENADKMSQEDYDVERRRWASELDYLSHGILAAIMDLFLLRKHILDARHHVEMAEIERSMDRI